MAHNYAAWIIICSGRAQNAISTLKSVALGHPKDADLSDALTVFKITDQTATSLANQMAEIEDDPQPHDGNLDKAEKLEFWGARAENSVKVMCETALYLVDHGTVAPPVVEIVELLEKIEEDATRLTMAVATRD